MVRQEKNTLKKYIRMGENRHSHNARLLRISCIFLFLLAGGSGADIGAHRSSRRDAPSDAGVMHRRFRNSRQRLVLYFNRRIHV